MRLLFIGQEPERLLYSEKPYVVFKKVSEPLSKPSCLQLKERLSP